MKVLIVNKFLYHRGGTEKYILRVGDCLKAQGHEVQYFGMDHEDRCVGNDRGVYISKMDFHQWNVRTAATYPVKLIYSFEARRKIRLILDDFRPDVVHLNNFTYQITPSVILEIVRWREENSRNCRIVFTAHDYNLVCPNHLMYNIGKHELCERCTGGHFYHCICGKCIHGSVAKSFVGALEGYFWKWQKAYRYIDTVICPSEFLKKKMDANPLLFGKTVTMINFIEDHEWKPIEKKNYVLYFGRYSEEKGIRTLIEACRALPDLRFVFAGAGVLEDLLSTVPNIENAGFLQGGELEQLIREARFTVCPSEWYENCPFSVIESQIYGTPVIGADLGGIPELISAGSTGDLFEAGNAADLKEKIEELWEDKARSEKYSSNCRNLIFDNITQYCEKLMNIYTAGKQITKQHSRSL